jgi:hypothetical protein
MVVENPTFSGFPSEFFRAFDEAGERTMRQRESTGLGNSLHSL